MIIICVGQESTSSFHRGILEDAQKGPRNSAEEIRVSSNRGTGVRLGHLPPGELELELEDQRSCCMVHVHGTFYIFSLNGQVDPLRHDPRLNHPRQHSEITKYMDAYWRQKEQENLQQ